MVSMDSCLALSMKPQVLTMMISASFGSSVISYLFFSIPSMISESTRFLSQPRLISPILYFPKSLFSPFPSYNWSCAVLFHFKFRYIISLISGIANGSLSEKFLLVQFMEIEKAIRIGLISQSVFSRQLCCLRFLLRFPVSISVFLGQLHLDD